MGTIPAGVIGTAFTEQVSWEALTGLIDCRDRMAGHEGERAGVAVIEKAFDTLGGRMIHADTFEIPGWWRGSSALVVGADRFEHPHELIALAGSPAGEVTARLANTDYGVPETIGTDVDGTIVMVRADNPSDVDRYYNPREKYQRAVEQGAVGVLVRNQYEGGLPVTGWIAGDGPAPILAASVSYELGARLARCADGGPIQLAIDCQHRQAESTNVEALIGPETDQEILVTAHHDAHDIAEGARDNAAGVAILCGMAQLLVDAGEELETAVRLVAFGAEELGFRGADAWARTHDLDAVKCVVNLDRIGITRDPEVRQVHSFEGMLSPFERAATRFDAPLVIDREMKPAGDSWPFARRGVPAVTVGSTTDRPGRGWGHTHSDTVDKVDRRDLRALALVYAEAVLHLADPGFDIPRESPAAVYQGLAPGYEDRVDDYHDVVDGT